MCSLLIRSNYVRKYDTITLCLGSSFVDYIFCRTFAKRAEITLQLRFAFDHHCDVLSLCQNYFNYLFGVTFLKASELCWIVEMFEMLKLRLEVNL